MKSSNVGIETERKILGEDLETARGIVATLYYLTKEAYSNELDEISNIIKKTTSEIDAWINKHMSKRESPLVDDSLYQSMNFMYLFCSSSKEVRAAIIRDLNNKYNN